MLGEIFSAVVGGFTSVDSASVWAPCCGARQAATYLGSSREAWSGAERWPQSTLGVQPMKFFARWYPTEEEMTVSEPLANGFDEKTTYIKYVDVNHEGKYKWFRSKTCLVPPTGKPTCQRA